MTGQHDLRVKFLAGQVIAILGEHCLVTGCSLPHSFPVINTVISITPNSWGGNRWPRKSLKLKLFMGISDEINVATIKFDNVSQEMTAKKVAEKCAACSGFFLLLYKHVAFLFSPFSHHHCGCKLSSRLWVASTLKKILDMWWFIENQKFEGKRVTKTTSAGTYRQAAKLTI